MANNNNNNNTNYSNLPDDRRGSSLSLDAVEVSESVRKGGNDVVLNPNTGQFEVVAKGSVPNKDAHVITAMANEGFASGY